MKNSKEKDLFKETIREKFRDEFLLTDRDNDIWNKVCQDIKGSKTIPFYKKNTWWYAAAAILVLASALTVSILLLKQKQQVIPAEVTAQNIDMVSSPSSVAESEVTEQKAPAVTSSSHPKKTIPVREDKNSPTAPDFANAENYSSTNTTIVKNLEDGSVVTLNTDTELKTEKTFYQNRNVLLNGEAFFDVKTDKAHPFTIYFDRYKLEVVGTQFNVRNRKGENYKEVTVLEGIVKVFNPASSENILVTKGQQLTLSAQGGTELKQVNPENFLSWKTGKLDFQKATLEDVAFILSRNNDAQITLDDSIKKCKFTGDLSGLSIEEAVQVLTLTNALTAEKTDGKFHLTGSSCE